MRAPVLLLLCALLVAGCATQEPPGSAPTGAPTPGPTPASPSPSPSPPAPPTPVPLRADEGARPWTVSLEGAASTTPEEPFRHPVLAEDPEGKTVYLATLSAPVGQDPRAKVVAMDAATGAFRWTYESREEHQDVPALLHHEGQGLVLVGTDSMTLLALDEHDGAPRWTRSFGVYGRFSALGLAGDGSILAAAFDARGEGRTYLASFDPATGDEQWNVTSGRGVIAAPNLVVAPEVAYMLSYEPRPPGPPMARVAAYGTRDGSLHWETLLAPHHGLAAEMALAPEGDALYVTTMSQPQETAPVALAALSAADGSMRWNASLPMGGVGALARSPDGALVCAAGPQGDAVVTRCLRAEDGTPHWSATQAPSTQQRRLDANGLGFSRDGGLLLLLVAGHSRTHENGLTISAGGEVHLVAYDADTGKPGWSRGWEREEPHGSAAGLLVSRHLPRAYMAAEGGAIHERTLSVDAVSLAR